MALTKARLLKHYSSKFVAKFRSIFRERVRNSRKIFRADFVQQTCHTNNGSRTALTLCASLRTVVVQGNERNTALSLWALSRCEYLEGLRFASTKLGFGAKPLRTNRFLETLLACRWEGVGLPRASGKSVDFPEFTWTSPTVPRWLSQNFSHRKFQEFRKG